MVNKEKLRLLDNKNLKKDILNQVIKSPVFSNVNSLLRMQQIYEAGLKRSNKVGNIRF